MISSEAGDLPRPTMSIVIPATDEPSTLVTVLEALEVARRPDDEVLVVREPRGATPAFARNRGAALARGSLVVFLDADVVPHPAALSRIRARFASDPGLHALIGSYDDTPAEPDAVSGFRNLLHHHVHQEAGGPIESFWSGLGAIRRESFLAVGGFDEGQFGAATIEDIDLGLRLASSGLRAELDPAVQGTHLKRWTVGSMVYSDLIYRGVPWVAVLLRNPGSPKVLNLGVRHQLSALASTLGALGLLTGRAAVPATALGALLALNRDFYALIRRRRGLRQAALAVPLHALHHLTSVVAVPLGIASFVRKPGRFHFGERHRPAGMRGLHLAEDRTPLAPSRRAWTSRPELRRRPG